MLFKRIHIIFMSAILMIYSSQSFGSRILGIFPLNGRSNMMFFEHMMKGLAKRGHQVDVISVFPQKKSQPNYTDIVIPSAIPPLVNNINYEKLQNAQHGNYIDMVSTIGNEICEKAMEYPEFQNLIKNPPRDPPYDLVMTQVFTAHCFMAFGHHLNVPVVGLSSSVLYPWANDFIANPENLAFIPHIFFGYTENMNFKFRLQNALFTVYSKILFNYYTATQSEIIKKHFGANAPNVREVERDLALILVNSHLTLNGVKPSTPAHVEVGGIHVVDDDTEIPQEYKQWLDESNDGFIYFTFGSMINIETFPTWILKILYKSLSKIAPVRVFIKVSNVELLPSGLPENFRTFSWIPQMKVLRHKNIRAFITHGGLIGTQEAISCSVPMIGIPLFFDQFANIDQYVRKKIAIRLDYDKMTEEKLDWALNQILHNVTYRYEVERISKKLLDRPLSAIDEACYWVEYIIRHGKNALRSPALEFSWWEIALLDVYFTVLIAIILLLFIIIILIKIFILMIIKSSVHVSLSKKSD